MLRLLSWFSVSRDNARCLLAWTINPNRRLNYYHFFKTDMEQSFRPTTVGKGLDYLSVHLSLFHYVSSSVNLSRLSYLVCPIAFVLSRSSCLVCLVYRRSVGLHSGPLGFVFAWGLCESRCAVAEFTFVRASLLGRLSTTARHWLSVSFQFVRSFGVSD